MLVHGSMLALRKHRTPHPFPPPPRSVLSARMTVGSFSSILSGKLNCVRKELKWQTPYIKRASIHQIPLPHSIVINCYIVLSQLITYPENSSLFLPPFGTIEKASSERQTNGLVVPSLPFAFFDRELGRALKPQVCFKIKFNTWFNTTTGTQFSVKSYDDWFETHTWLPSLFSVLSLVCPS